MRVYEIYKCKGCKKDIQIDIGKCGTCKTIDEYWIRKKQKEYFCKNYRFELDNNNKLIIVKKKG